MQVRDEDERSDRLVLSVVSIEPPTNPPVFQFINQMLVAVGKLDREKVPEYRVTVRVTDSGGEVTHWSQKVLTITVSDKNDNPAIFSNFPTPVYIAEGKCPASSQLADHCFGKKPNQSSRLKI